MQPGRHSRQNVLTISAERGKHKALVASLENVWLGSDEQEKRAMRRTAYETNMRLWRDTYDLASTGGTFSLASMCKRKKTYNLFGTSKILSCVW